MKWPTHVTICEVGLRDGLQNEKMLLTVDQKIDLLKREQKLLKSVLLFVLRQCLKWRTLMKLSGE
ncbi:hypothetical protein [Pelosinus baikalensis]|uniref:Uncharacterized protein n=1 Tax=Pelosinus baikalensis TaxID=2892015 RepID=A0ABS8HZ16_9FIRM|nr:hypothetical protein [Pelosinus baikalensis]MCC5468390.1 hypothetical protein [Pelosinus baikalensis]